MAYGDHTLNANLSNGLEVDNFTFQGVSGDSLRVWLHSFTGGFDPRLTLRGPTGTVLNMVQCGGAGSSLCSTGFLDQTLTATGTYTLNVFGFDPSEPGNYQLHLDRYPPTNNFAGIKYSTPVHEVLGHTTDMDFFAFNGVAGSGVRVSLASDTGGLDPMLEVFDINGNKLFSNFCGGAAFSLCSRSFDFAVPTTGIYKIGISESGGDETGNYHIELSCLFGNCPSPLAAGPSPLAAAVPEPETYAMMLAGLTVVAGLAKRRRKH